MSLYDWQMMEKKEYHFEYTKYAGTDELENEDRELIEAAVAAAENAYVPYSHFRVGAAVRLENGEILAGNNQENASYPVGICAERTLLSFVHANFPDQKMLTLAVTVLDTDAEVSPCGLCRQTILEYENLQEDSIRILLHNKSGSVLSLPSGSSLLPLHFDSGMLS